MPLVLRGNKVQITNSSNNPLPVDPNDVLPLHLLDITQDRMDKTKWGRNTWFGSSLDVDTTERILSPAAVNIGIEITFPTSAVRISVASTSGLDTSAGVGAQTILVRGLDSNYDEQDELISLTGQTPSTTIASFLRINDIFVINAGSNGFNVGNIYVSDINDTFILGEPQTRLYMAMEIGDNLSKTAIYTVPNGQKWTATWLLIQTTATESNPMKVKIYKSNSRQGGNTFQLRDKFYVQGSSQIDMSHITFVEEKSDIYITVEKDNASGQDPEIHLKICAIEQNI